jgi:hypothetical protein
MFASVLRLDILALPSGNFLVTEPFRALFLLSNIADIRQLLLTAEKFAVKLQ